MAAIELLLEARHELVVPFVVSAAAATLHEQHLLLLRGHHLPLRGTLRMIGHGP
jgi:hypothetical protein